MASATGTAAASTTDSENKTVMGHPLPAIPPSANVIIGNPHLASPPEPTPPPVNLQQLFRRSVRRNRFNLPRHDQILLYRLTAAALFFFVLMACIIFVLWLVLRPHLPQLQITSVKVSPLSTTNSSVSASCNVSILLTNPNNKLKAFYDNFEVHIHYQRTQALLSEIQVPPFAQPGKSDTFLHAHLQINNANVGKDAVQALKEDLDHGWVSFGVKIFALLRLESKEWRTRSQLMKFNCHDVIIGFSVTNGSGVLLDPFKECQVAL